MRKNWITFPSSRRWRPLLHCHSHPPWSHIGIFNNQQYSQLHFKFEIRFCHQELRKNHTYIVDIKRCLMLIDNESNLITVHLRKVLVTTSLTIKLELDIPEKSPYRSRPRSLSVGVRFFSYLISNFGRAILIEVSFNSRDFPLRTSERRTWACQLWQSVRVENMLCHMWGLMMRTCWVTWEHVGSHEIMLSHMRTRGSHENMLGPTWPRLSGCLGGRGGERGQQTPPDSPGTSGSPVWGLTPCLRTTSIRWRPPGAHSSPPSLPRGSLACVDIISMERFSPLCLVKVLFLSTPENFPKFQGATMIQRTWI